MGAKIKRNAWQQLESALTKRLLLEERLRRRRWLGVGYEVAVSKVFIKDNAAAAATPHQSALADSFSSRRSPGCRKTFFDSLPMQVS